MMSTRPFRRAAALAAAAYCVLGAAAVSPLPAHAQAVLPPGPLSLTQALLAARENLDVTLARHGATAARADILAANRSPYPVLSAKASQIDLQNGIGPGNVVTGKRIDKSVGIDWTYERGNKRELRTTAAQRVAEAAEADLADIRVQQQLGALGAYFDLLAAQQRIAEVQEVTRSAGVLADTARRRVQAGDLAAQEQARTEIEAQRSALDLRGAQLERDRAAIALGFFLGAPAPLGLTAGGDWPALDNAERAAVDLAALVEQRADVRAADARLAAAQALYQGALASRKADLTVGASLDHYPGTSTRLVELRVQMPLFWGYAQQGEIARGQALLTQAESAAARTRLAASAELQRLRQEALSAAARASSYETDILPRARRVAEQAEFAFRRGASSLTDLLDARRTLRATLLDALTARADYAKADGTWQLRTQPSAFGLPGETAPPLPAGAAYTGAVAVPLGGAAPGAAALPSASTSGAPATSTMPAAGTPAATSPPAALTPPSPGVPAAAPATPVAPPNPLPGAAAGAGAPSVLTPPAAPSPRPGDAAATTPLRRR